MASVTLLFVHVVPAHHSTAHRPDPVSQQVTDYAVDVLFLACARSCLSDKTLQTGPVAHILYCSSTVNSGQGIRLNINDHVVPRLRIREA
jgi:hypothetical protein